MMDKITPLSAPPGHSLTGNPGQWPWERPPEFADPNEVIDTIIGRLENGNGKEDLTKMMLAGITVEELVDQISLKGFMNGAFSADVAELIKPAMAVYMIGLADDAGFSAKLFVRNPEEDEELSDDTFFNIMRERNPQMHSDMIEEMNRQKRMNVQRASRVPEEQPARQPSFLNALEN